LCASAQYFCTIPAFRSTCFLQFEVAIRRAGLAGAAFAGREDDAWEGRKGLSFEGPAV
jgi:hypothetical protein